MAVTKQLMSACLKAARAMGKFCVSIDIDEVFVEGGADYMSLTLEFENVKARVVIFVREGATEPIFLGKGFKLNNKTFEGIAQSAKSFAVLRSQLVC